jgi:hypothetical protein
VPDAHGTVPGAEVVDGVDAVVHQVDGEPLSRSALEDALAELDVSWTRLLQGRVFDAASVNDVESTEAIRRSLARQDAPVIQPLCYLRRDRRARTDAFRAYLSELAERGAIEQARIVGENLDPFVRAADFPVLTHDHDTHAGRVLDDALDDGWPVVLMGNTVAEFMRDLEAEIEGRVADREQIECGVPDRETASVDHAPVDPPGRTTPGSAD